MTDNGGAFFKHTFPAGLGLRVSHCAYLYFIHFLKQLDFRLLLDNGKAYNPFSGLLPWFIFSCVFMLPDTHAASFFRAPLLYIFTYHPFQLTIAR